MVNRFSKYLLSLLPRTGRIIAEDGTTINEADISRDSLDFTGARITADIVRSMNHVGKLFSVAKKFVLPASGAVWITGETDWSTVHFVGERYQSTLGGIDVELREGIAATGGTEIVPICRNRKLDHIKISTFYVLEAPTVTDEGTLLDTVYFPELTSPQGRVPMSGSDGTGWALARGTKYGIKFINLTADEKTVQGKFVWYEPEL